MKKSLVILFLALILAGSATAEARRFAFVTRSDGMREHLSRLDLSSDTIADDFILPRDNGFRFYLADQLGNCYLSQYHNSDDYQEDIYYFDSDNKDLKIFANIHPAFGPLKLVLTPDQLIASAHGSAAFDPHVKGGIIFINRQTGSVEGSVFIEKDNQAIQQADIRDFYFDGKKYIFSATFYWKVDPMQIGPGAITVIDREKQEIVKTIAVPAIYTHPSGIITLGDKIYLACEGKFVHPTEIDRKLGLSPCNDELLVFSFATGKIIRKIKVAPHPYKLAFDPKTKLIFVQHSTSDNKDEKVEIIDSETDKVVGSIAVNGARALSIVKPGKLYITYENYHIDSGLLVVDAMTKKIIKRFDGDYHLISEYSSTD